MHPSEGKLELVSSTGHSIKSQANWVELVNLRYPLEYTIPCEVTFDEIGYEPDISEFCDTNCLIFRGAALVGPDPAHLHVSEVGMRPGALFFDSTVWLIPSCQVFLLQSPYSSNQLSDGTDMKITHSLFLVISIPSDGRVLVIYTQSEAILVSWYRLILKAYFQQVMSANGLLLTRDAGTDPREEMNNYKRLLTASEDDHANLYLRQTTERNSTSDLGQEPSRRSPPTATLNETIRWKGVFAVRIGALLEFYDDEFAHVSGQAPFHSIDLSQYHLCMSSGLPVTDPEFGVALALLPAISQKITSEHSENQLDWQQCVLIPHNSASHSLSYESFTADSAVELPPCNDDYTCLLRCLRADVPLMSRMQQEQAMHPEFISFLDGMTSRVPYALSLSPFVYDVVAQPPSALGRDFRSFFPLQLASSLPQLVTSEDLAISDTEQPISTANGIVYLVDGTTRKKVGFVFMQHSFSLVRWPSQREQQNAIQKTSPGTLRLHSRTIQLPTQPPISTPSSIPSSPSSRDAVGGFFIERSSTLPRRDDSRDQYSAEPIVEFAVPLLLPDDDPVVVSTNSCKHIQDLVVGRCSSPQSSSNTSESLGASPLPIPMDDSPPSSSETHCQTTSTLTRVVHNYLNVHHLISSPDMLPTLSSAVPLMNESGTSLQVVTTLTGHGKKHYLVIFVTDCGISPNPEPITYAIISAPFSQLQLIHAALLRGKAVDASEWFNYVMQMRRVPDVPQRYSEPRTAVDQPTGKIHRRAKNQGRWQKVWCMLAAPILSFYPSRSSTNPSDVIRLTEDTITVKLKPMIRKSKSNVFELSSSGDSQGRRAFDYLLHCSSEAQYMKWIDALCAAGAEYEFPEVPECVPPCSPFFRWAYVSMGEVRSRSFVYIDGDWLVTRRKPLVMDDNFTAAVLLRNGCTIMPSPSPDCIWDLSVVRDGVILMEIRFPGMVAAIQFYAAAQSIISSKSHRSNPPITPALRDIQITTSDNPSVSKVISRVLNRSSTQDSIDAPGATSIHQATPRYQSPYDRTRDESRAIEATSYAGSVWERCYVTMDGANDWTIMRFSTLPATIDYPHEIEPVFKSIRLSRSLHEITKVSSHSLALSWRSLTQWMSRSSFDVTTQENHDIIWLRCSTPESCDLLANAGIFALQKRIQIPEKTDDGYEPYSKDGTCFMNLYTVDSWAVGLSVEKAEPSSPVFETRRGLFDFSLLDSDDEEPPQMKSCRRPCAAAPAAVPGRSVCDPMTRPYQLSNVQLSISEGILRMELEVTPHRTAIGAAAALAQLTGVDRMSPAITVRWEDGIVRPLAACIIDSNEGTPLFEGARAVIASVTITGASILTPSDITADMKNAYISAKKAVGLTDNIDFTHTFIIRPHDPQQGDSRAGVCRDSYVPLPPDYLAAIRAQEPAVAAAYDVFGTDETLLSSVGLRRPICIRLRGVPEDQADTVLRDAMESAVFTASALITVPVEISIVPNAVKRVYEMVQKMSTLGRDMGGELLTERGLSMISKEKTVETRDTAEPEQTNEQQTQQADAMDVRMIPAQSEIVSSLYDYKGLGSPLLDNTERPEPVQQSPRASSLRHSDSVLSARVFVEHWPGITFNDDPFWAVDAGTQVEGVVKRVISIPHAFGRISRTASTAVSSGAVSTCASIITEYNEDSQSSARMVPVPPLELSGSRSTGWVAVGIQFRAAPGYGVEPIIRVKASGVAPVSISLGLNCDILSDDKEQLLLVKDEANYLLRLPQDYYQEIRRCISLVKGALELQGSDRAGYLLKMGGARGGWRNWKRRWVTLNKGVLTYYETDDKKKELGKIVLWRAKVLSQNEIMGQDYTKAPPNTKVFAVEDLAGRVLYLAALSEKQADDWMLAIKLESGCGADGAGLLYARTFNSIIIHEPNDTNLMLEADNSHY